MASRDVMRTSMPPKRLGQGQRTSDQIADRRRASLELDAVAAEADQLLHSMLICSAHSCMTPSS